MLNVRLSGKLGRELIKTNIDEHVNVYLTTLGREICPSNRHLAGACRAMLDRVYGPLDEGCIEVINKEI